MKVSGLFTVLFFSCFTLWGGDTLFIRNIELPGRVRNIDYDGRNLLIRLDHSLFQYSNGILKRLEVPIESRYTWFSKGRINGNTTGLFHTEYIYQNDVIPKGALDNILPGLYTNNITSVLAGNTMYISYRGVLLEYLVQNNISFSHRGRSIRHVFSNDSVKIFSTYDGIYMDRTGKFNQRLLKGTDYSNGELALVNGRFFLCEDRLMLLEGDTIFRPVNISKDGASFRKLAVWNNKVVSLLNKRLSFFDPATYTEEATLLSGSVDEFNDIEIIDSTLFCCTTSGKIYSIGQHGIEDSIRLMGALHDIQANGGRLLVSSDSGLFVLNTDLTDVHRQSGLPCLQTVVHEDNIFISTLSGLFILRNDSMHILIPNVEFNKRALSIFDNYLYAGSVDGLYGIHLTQFNSKILPTLSPYYTELEEQKLPLKWILLTGLFILLSAGLTAFYFIRRRKPQILIIENKPVFSLDLVADTIRQNEDIISVQALSERLDISIVQLNRKLKPYGESPLSLMQKVKKEIALDMQAKGFGMDEIAKRTGYSKRYVRENFFK